MSSIKKAIKLYKTDRTTFNISIASRLAKSKISHLIPDKVFLNIQYKAYFGKKPNWKDPCTFNEKLQWLKLYNRKAEHCLFVDKFEVKNFISENLGEEYIIPTLGLWDTFEEIDFDKLPDKFVLKCTHDSGSVVICRDKSTFDISAAEKKIKRKLKSNLFWHGREWPYKNLKPKIIAEQYMEDNVNQELTDYKFYCFNGEPNFLYISKGLENHETAAISFLTLDWKFAPYERTDFKPFAELPPKPKTFDLMVETARKLSAGMDFLRVDLYEINGKMYFSEMTFFPGSGFTRFKKPEHDVELGDMIALSSKKDSRR